MEALVAQAHPKMVVALNLCMTKNRVVGIGCGQCEKNALRGLEGWCDLILVTPLLDFSWARSVKGTLDLLRGNSRPGGLSPDCAVSLESVSKQQPERGRQMGMPSRKRIMHSQGTACEGPASPAQRCWCDANLQPDFALRDGRFPVLSLCLRCETEACRYSCTG